ncbi:uncharacterized protein LOC113872340 [Abrus precatorius]|uniref:Uncharacterized protein LOC113872340 n=1 Tax=Abrus precatorius TaxID=3816 RepID=A0A8B8MCN5_ABRPR|nr:uncharacterized protein LOC113872340 [Abrus precatorius]XP_027365629.1 uncharacterized protein LOC113872340 [Abrus precatorius]
MAQEGETQTQSPIMPEPITTRPMGGTEFSWCKAVPVGTGVTVLSLLLSKPPPIPLLQNALHNLQKFHPILRSKIHHDPSSNTFHFLTPPNPSVHIQSFDIQSTSHIVQTQSNGHDPFHTLLEHEMNSDTWSDPTAGDTNILYASTYTISHDRFAVFLRLHTSACDRAAAVALLKELLRRVGENAVEDETKDEKVNLAMEDMIPEGKMNKPFWARGLDVLGYSLNALRFANLSFVDANSPRSSRIVRLQLTADETKYLLAGCKSRGIKLCGVLAAAGMIASRTSKCLPDHQREKYAVVTLIDCRPILDPVLSSNHAGFYHSAILNTHDVCDETLWELAKRSYAAFVNALNCNKHFSDMSDLNFLMCKAIDNPGLTPSSSLRTALISVFEDPVFDDSAGMHEELGLEDYVGCASAHGVGPSIAIFDTIRDGKLDCACIYPSPLHSREQIEGLVDHMKRILVDGYIGENQ